MIKMNASREWLVKMAVQEGDAIVSAGGWVADLKSTYGSDFGPVLPGLAHQKEKHTLAVRENPGTYQQGGPTWEQLIAFVRTIDGMTLETLKQRKRFKIEISGDTFIITPEKTQHPRRMIRSKGEEFLAHFSKTRSWSPSTYTEITYNSSYYLTLLREWSKR